MPNNGIQYSFNEFQSTSLPKLLKYFRITTTINQETFPLNKSFALLELSCWAINSNLNFSTGVTLKLMVFHGYSTITNNTVIKILPAYELFGYEFQQLEYIHIKLSESIESIDPQMNVPTVGVKRFKHIDFFSQNMELRC